MADVNVPYNELELQIALIRVYNRINDDPQFMEDFEKKVLSDLPRIEDKKDLNRLTAEHNGISLEALIESPNYPTLIADYTSHRISRMIEFLQEFNFSEVEAWAFVLRMLNKIS